MSEVDQSTPSVSEDEEVSQPPSSLGVLQTEDQSKLLDVVDLMSDEGSHPRIVLCGDRSSGKVDILRAITSIPFLRSSTKFTTKVVLRPAQANHYSVIVLEPETQTIPVEKLIDNIEEFEEFLDAAYDTIKVHEGGPSPATLNIVIAGPTQTNLTILDLPDLVTSKDENISEADAEMLSDFILENMKDDRSIILAVVSQIRERHQTILQMVVDLDNSGPARTLGILKIADTSDADVEEAAITLAKNELVHLQLGWHVLFYGNPEDNDSDLCAAEMAFFQRDGWKNLSPADIGSDALVFRLSLLLLEHIKRELPGMQVELNNGISACQKKLDRKISTTAEQKEFLMGISTKMEKLCVAAVEGQYEHEVFDPEPLDSSRNRLRTHIEQLNRAFADDMCARGHAIEIRDALSFVPPNSEPGSPKVLNYSEAVEWARKFLENNRGSELPGTHNSRLVRELFIEQSNSWPSLARSHIQKILKSCQITLKGILNYVAPEEVASAMLEHWINKELRELVKKVQSELDKLLEDRKKAPKTYSTDFIEGLRAARLESQKRIAKSTLQSLPSFPPTSPEDLMRVILATQTRDLDESVCIEALDYMVAYYKVSCNKFIDNVAIIVTERELLGRLSEIFTRRAVDALSLEDIASITESVSLNEAGRKNMENQIKALGVELELCEEALKIALHIELPTVAIHADIPAAISTQDIDEHKNITQTTTQIVPAIKLEEVEVRNDTANSSPPASFFNPPIPSQPIPLAKSEFGVTNQPVSTLANVLKPAVAVLHSSFGKYASTGGKPVFDTSRIHTNGLPWACAVPSEKSCQICTDCATIGLKPIPIPSQTPSTPSSSSAPVSEAPLTDPFLHTQSPLHITTEPLYSSFEVEKPPFPSDLTIYTEKSDNSFHDQAFQSVAASSRFRNWSFEEIRLNDYANGIKLACGNFDKALG